ncbi:ArpU family phage transcriptional regulator [Aneurinibacillus soli]|uniref:Uncharacterized protein n=1 Tax=Aneurinibacillus soli TaxID=1500254 RepID=A0A0U5B1P7_9BACL|nr:ArpU family phage packaging/lysis transcriptional regulator [Aneurinibacillus soli]PYE64259.1 ArpU family phage transcriptional regulator [Aneurinibacillus soli]BAU28208.1 hypothetical protein CB4_02382 [Aneurinibacillus soli]
MSQSFLPEIDRKATKKRVEEVLETVRIYRRVGFVRREINNVSNYESQFSSKTNKIDKPVENCAIWNVEHEGKIVELSNRIEFAVNKLPQRQKEIIEKRYLGEESNFDYLVANEVRLSERTYRREKSRAIYILALMLKLEVLENAGDK